MMRKNVNIEVFIKYFAYQNHLVLARDLCKANQAENEEIVKEPNDALIYWNDLNKKKVSRYENPDNVINIVHRIPDLINNYQVKDPKR